MNKEVASILDEINCARWEIITGCFAGSSLLPVWDMIDALEDDLDEITFSIGE